MTARISRTSSYKQKILSKNRTLKKKKEYSVSVKINNLTDISDNDDVDFKPLPSRSSAKLQWQMRVQLQATALISDRYNVSYRATAAIASSVLQDFDLITETDASHVVDQSKIRREKSRAIEKIGNKHFRRNIKEEHYSLIAEPGFTYLGHVSPLSSSAKNIANSIKSYISQTGLPLDKLEVVGCDGTVTNTGRKNGIIHQIKAHLGRPLQWSVCLLHFNELPFRHLFQHLDGLTTGPTSYSGSIGQQLRKCAKLPVIKFKSIDCNFP